MSKLKLFRINELSHDLSMGKSTIWAWVKLGKFPKPIKISSRMTVWSSADVEEWLANKG